MSPFVLLILALLTPFLLTALLLIPPYLGMSSAAYIIYAHGSGPHPLSGRWLDVFYMVDVYSKLLTYWWAHVTSVSVFTYSLPVVALPLIGLVLALWLARKFVRKMRDVFHLSASV